MTITHETFVAAEESFLSNCYLQRFAGLMAAAVHPVPAPIPAADAAPIRRPAPAGPRRQQRPAGKWLAATPIAR